MEVDLDSALSIVYRLKELVEKIRVSRVEVVLFLEAGVDFL